MKKTVTISQAPNERVPSKPLEVELSADFAGESYEDVSFMTSMILVLLGNYAQTGHFGGPLSYTPANVAVHLGGPENGGMRYDIRNPKHPLTDKFMLAGGHCVPTCYALWMVLFEAMAREQAATGDAAFSVDPEIAILGIDALGFRRSPGAVTDLLESAGVADEPLFAQAKLRGIRALMGHAETTDATNDVNGGPSGIGVANAAGKAMFWDFVGAPDDIKVIAFEGEFAFTEGHAQELKTIALAQQVGKRLRVFFSYNNAGIDDALIGPAGVINEKYKDIYDIAAQWTSYGWNVFEVADGADPAQLAAAFKAMEDWPKDDRRPMVVIAQTVKGWWPGAKDGKVGSVDQIISYQSHPYGFGCNTEYFVQLAGTFEQKFGVQFEGIRDGSPKTEADRLRQFKTNIDIALSVMDKNDGALRKWITGRLMNIAGTLHSNPADGVRFSSTVNPFRDERLRVENLPLDGPQELVIKHPTTGKEIKVTCNLSLPAGVKKGTRRAISEIGKWLNYVTGNRFLTIAADLSNSINVEAANLTGHYDPATNPTGTRLKAGIQECVNAATVCGLVSQTVAEDPKEHCGVWAASGTYGAFTPLMYLPVRIFSQQNQDSPFRLGVVNIVAGHSGPETAADARSHFGIFSPQVWNLFPEGQVINLHFWDYNDVAPAYFAAVQATLSSKSTGVIVIHVARPDMTIVDRNTLADSDPRAAAKGCYLLRDFKDGPRHGTVLVQGSSSTVNLVKVFGRLEAEGINVRVVSVVSEDLFRLQSQEYRESVFPLSAAYDCMVISTGTKRFLPLSGLGPLTRAYSMTSDHDDRWRSGGLEPDVIAEAQLDEQSIFDGVKRFANARDERLKQQREAFGLL